MKKIFLVFFVGLIFAQEANNKKVHPCNKEKDKKIVSYALLIGISKYKDEEIDELDGPENDLELMRNLLKNRFCFDKIYELKNHEATKKRILEKLALILDELVKVSGKTQKKPNFVWYFSGHGGQKPDGPPNKNDEIDDEILLTFKSLNEKT